MSKVQFLFFLIPVIAYSQAPNPWEKFVSSPNEKNFLRCEAQIRQSITKVSETDSTITLVQVSDIEYNFLPLVANGNRYAMELCFQLYQIFPPGYAADIEYFDGALGMSASHSPEPFIKLLCKYETVYQDFSAHDESVILGVTPDLSDRLPEQRVEYARRLAAIESIHDTNCPAIRERCIKVLKDWIKHLDDKDE